MLLQENSTPALCFDMSVQFKNLLFNTPSVSCHRQSPHLCFSEAIYKASLYRYIYLNVPLNNNSLMLKCSNWKLCMLTDWSSRLSHAGSFLGFPPSLILCSSPSGLGAGSYTRPAVGGVLEHALTCCAAWVKQRDTASESGRERERRGSWSTVWQCEVTHTMDKLLLVSTPACTRWRQAWMEELHCCHAAWWVSKLFMD